MALRLQSRSSDSLGVDVRRSRSSESRRSDVDETLLVKAAAWAWYQRGNERKASSEEFSIVAKQRQQGGHRPSRHKLEAIQAEHARRSSMEVPLVDAYELERITAQLKNVSVCDGRRIGGVETEEKKKRVGGRVNGLWQRRGIRICGTGRDAVVEAKTPVPSRRLVADEGGLEGGGQQVLL